MEEFGIPYFIDRKREIISYPLIELVRSVLEALSYRFTYESMFPNKKTTSLSIHPWSSIYTLQTSCVLHVPCLSVGYALAQVLTQNVHPISLHPEVTRNCSTPPEVFLCISLYRVSQMQLNYAVYSGPIHVCH